MVKFIYLEKATKIWRNFQILFKITLVESKKISRVRQIFVAFLEYTYEL